MSTEKTASTKNEMEDLESGGGPRTVLIRTISETRIKKFSKKNTENFAASQLSGGAGENLTGNLQWNFRN